MLNDPEVALETARALPKPGGRRLDGGAAALKLPTVRVIRDIFDLLSQPSG